MKRMKTWLSGLLCAGLLAGMLPTAALAGGDAVDQELSRGQATAEIAAAYGILNVPFGDLEACTDGQREAITALYAAEMLSGTGETEFTPDGAVTRQEAAALVWMADNRKNQAELGEAGWAQALDDLQNSGILSQDEVGTRDGTDDPYLIDGDVYITEADLGEWLNCSSGYDGALTRAQAVEMVVDGLLPFTDLDGCTTEERAAVKAMYFIGCIDGTDGDSFSPDAPCPRFQAVILLCRVNGGAIGAPEQGLFNDVDAIFPDNEQASQAAAQCFDTLVELGMLTEADRDETGAFRPYETLSRWDLESWLWSAGNGELTRAVLAEMIYASPIFGIDEPSGSENYFTDIENCTQEQITAIYALAEAGIISGTTPTTFSPDETLTRGQAAIALWRAAGAFDHAPEQEIFDFSQADGLYQSGDFLTAVNYLVARGILTQDDCEQSDFYPGDTAMVLDVQVWLERSYAYPITIIGPTGSMASGIELNEDGSVAAIQGSDTTLYNPKDNPDAAVQEQLANWVYNGWLFTAVRGEEVETYGPTKVLDDGLLDFLNAKVAQGGWTLSMDSKSQGYYVYPITIIGPTDTWTDAPAIRLAEDGTVAEVQTAQAAPDGEKELYDPRTNEDEEIRDQLANWVYNGWLFTAVRGEEVETYGPTKVLDDGLLDFLNAKVAQGGWTLSMDSKSQGHYTSSGGSSSGGSSSSTTTNPDGSTTTTVTRGDGTTVETTKQPDGSQQVVETAKDGTVTTTTTDAQGNETEVVEHTDGSTVTNVSNADGASSTTTVSADGRTAAEVTVPAAVVEQAQQANEIVALPMPGVTAPADKASAPVVTISLPANTSAKVEIPVANVTSGTVAVLVKEDGTEEVVKSTLATENGVAITVSDGETVKIVDNSKSFQDLDGSHWASGYVAFAVSRELFAGTGDGTFAPEADMTRGMIVTVLASYTGVNTVAPQGEAWYSVGCQWAVDHGISDGSGMEENLTREQLAVMLWGYAGRPESSAGLDAYGDSASASDWAVQAMAWAVENGLISGMDDGTLNPQGTATRAQVATILFRFVSLTA